MAISEGIYIVKLSDEVCSRLELQHTAVPRIQLYVLRLLHFKLCSHRRLHHGSRAHFKYFIFFKFNQIQ